jgi:amidase
MVFPSKEDIMHMVSMNAVRVAFACLIAGALLSGTAPPPASAANAPAPKSATAAKPASASASTSRFEEMTIAELQEGLKAGRWTSKELVQAYIARIEALDRKGPSLHAVIEINPDAIAIAESLDAERRAKGPRGPLHGIPVLVKDNIDTADRMSTTAGSLALAGVRRREDSAVAARLRAAGAVILGKTNLSEWANIRSTHASSGWSARGGQVRNPYALDRSPSGSSSGTGAAIAANFAAAGIGTETDGSIVSPSSVNSLVGLKPTVGLVSRAGIVPISHHQDTAGPMCRTVADAATLLGALTGVDPRDPATRESEGHALRDYTPFLDASGLKGARIGVVRKDLTGFHPASDRITEDAVAAMKQAGAVIVDSLAIPGLAATGDPEFTVLLYDLKSDLDAYLGALGADSPVHSLANVIAWNEAHSTSEMPYFRQELFIRAQATGGPTDTTYARALARCREFARSLDSLMIGNQLDALFAPTDAPPWSIDLVDGDHYLGGSSTAAAVAGTPHITVPGGYTFGLPIGVSFFGRAWSEGTLIRIAYAFEQATKHRRPPAFRATADLSGRP